MQRKRLAAILPLIFAPAAWGADVTPGVDFYAGAYGWDAQPSGSFSSTIDGASVDKIDVEDDLDFSTNQNNILYIGVEHAVPLIPNVRLRSADISDSSTAQLTRNFTYEGQAFTAADTVSSRYQLDYQEATLYYTPLDTVAKVDLGLTVRKFDAEFEIESRTPPQRRGFVAAEGTVPMLHVGVAGDLPLNGFYAKGKVDVISYDGNDLTDARVALGWRSDMVLGVEAGYQRFALKLDDVDDLDADLTLAGPYLALSLSF